MNSLNMPGFTAEAALYKMSGRYRLSAAVGSLGDTSTTVYPQACNWWTWLGCKGSLATCKYTCSLTFGQFWPCVDLCMELSGAGPGVCGEC